MPRFLTTKQNNFQKHAINLIRLRFNYTLADVRFFVITRIFTLIIITSLTGILANDSIPTTISDKHDTTIHQDFRLGIHLASSFHIPITHANYHWNTYFTTGFHIEFPMQISGMYIKLAAEAGNVDMKTLNINNVKILHSSLSFSYDFPLYSNLLYIRPRLGLSNTVISLEHDMSTKEFIEELSHPTKNFESEFGALICCEPFFRYKRFQLSVPLYAEVMFSSPKIYATGNFSLVAGVIF